MFSERCKHAVHGLFETQSEIKTMLAAISRLCRDIAASRSPSEELIPDQAWVTSISPPYQKSS
jgi:hypothetical protein